MTISKGVRWMGLLTFAGIVSVTAMSARSGSPDTPVDAESLFKTRCANCHGADGSGTRVGKGLGAPDLRSAEVQEQSDADLAEAVKSGKGNMPPFSDRLSAAEITGLIKFVRTLKDKKSSAVKPQAVYEDARINLDPAKEQRNWLFGGTAGNNHYSTLAQINRENVKRLVQVWSFDTEEQGGLQTSPVVVDGVLYGITPTQKIFALDAATGKLFWKFDSGIPGKQPDRGLAYWSDGKDKRILVGVM